MNCQLCGGREALERTGAVLVCRDCLHATAAFAASAAEGDLREVWNVPEPVVDATPSGHEDDPRIQEFVSEVRKTYERMDEEARRRLRSTATSETHADLASAYFDMGLHGDAVREAARAILMDTAHPPALAQAARLLFHDDLLMPGAVATLQRHLKG